MLEWDIDAIFEAAGGPTALQALLARHCAPAPPPDLTTINMWKYRRRIARAWLPTVVYTLLRENKARFSDLLYYRTSPAAVEAAG